MLLVLPHIIPRNNVLKFTPKSASKKTPFIATFHLRLPKFNSIFNKFNNLLSEDFCLKTIFPKKPITLREDVELLGIF